MTPRSPALAASLGLVPRRRRSMPSGGPTDALAPPPRGTPPGHGLVPPLPTRRPRRPSSLAQGPCTYRLLLTTGLRATTGWSFWVAAAVRERRRGCQCWGPACRVEVFSLIKVMGRARRLTRSAPSRPVLLYPAPGHARGTLGATLPFDTVMPNHHQLRSHESPPHRYLLSFAFCLPLWQSASPYPISSPSQCSVV